MGSQRGSGSLSKSQTESAQKAYSESRPVAEKIAQVSPSLLIKRKAPKNNEGVNNQQENNNPNPNA